MSQAAARRKTRYSRRPAPAGAGLPAWRAVRLWLRPIGVVARRELASYLATPLAAVFIVVFLVSAAVATFEIGGFFARGQADLEPFFRFHPWLYLWLAPALAMRLWAEERRTGTVELLLTLPIGAARAAIGKVLAAWLVIALALALSTPLWLTVAWLGDPDHGVIAAGYLASLLLAGAYVAIGAAASAASKSQVIAFIAGFAVALALTAPGSSPVTALIADWVPDRLVGVLSWFSLEARYRAMVRGVIDPRDLLFLVSVIVYFVGLSGLLVARTAHR